MVSDSVQMGKIGQAMRKQLESLASKEALLDTALAMDHGDSLAASPHEIVRRRTQQGSLVPTEPAKEIRDLPVTNDGQMPLLMIKTQQLAVFVCPLVRHLLFRGGHQQGVVAGRRIVRIAGRLGDRSAINGPDGLGVCHGARHGRARARLRDRLRHPRERTVDGLGADARLDGALEAREASRGLPG